MIFVAWTTLPVLLLFGLTIWALFSNVLTHVSGQHLRSRIMFGAQVTTDKQLRFVNCYRNSCRCATPNVEIHRIVAGAPHHAYTQCGDTQDSCRWATSRIHPMWRYTGQLRVRHITHTPNVEIHRIVAGAPHHAYTQCGDAQDSCRCATSRIHPMWRCTGQLQVRHITHTPNVEIHRTVAGAPHHAYTQCGDTQDSCECAT